MTQTENVPGSDTNQAMIDALANNGATALAEFRNYTQEQVDHIVHQAALAALDQHMAIAKHAVEETGRGIYEDKCIKNIFASEYIWNSIKHNKTVGIIHEDKTRGIIEIAEPVGVVAGVTPTTNPTSTTIFKALIAMKTRNPIIFAFHPSAQESSAHAARVVYDAALKAGAPENCIQWIDTPSVEATGMLMNHPKVALVLATGGAGMVKAAYSTGKPALGVGPGNVPVYIDKTAKISRTVNDLLLSKTFDSGMICASEQTVLVHTDVEKEFRTEFEKFGGYFLNKTERAKLEKYMITDKGSVNPALVGSKARAVAEAAGLKVPADTKVLIVPIDGVGKDHPFSQEKLLPVLGFKAVKDAEEGFDLANQLLEFGGLGHTAAIHTRDTKQEREYGIAMRACRIVVNSPTSQGGIGDLYNGLIPSLTLGCGSYGHNSVSRNVSAIDLINIKRIAERRNNMQWFKVPKTYFERYSTQYLRDMENVNRVFLVTDPGMVQFGYVDIVLEQLRARRNNVEWQIFSDVEPNPSSDTVFRGVEAMNGFKPDCIIALGGGSAMDAAKGMWMFYEDGAASYFGMKQKFMDIRKRTYSFPKLGEKAQFVAIPTTSGTGSECTPFAVITDSENHVKYPIADYAILPNVAIADAQFVDTVPARTAADSGMDALTHAIESYVSVMASDYTKGLSLRAIGLIFENLPKSVLDGDTEAKEKMHNASTIAGIAFANAFLGIVHSLSHKVGAEFNIAHGRTNAIFLPHVINYNAQRPVKHAIFPKYETFRADEDLAEIARFLGLPAATAEEGVASLVKAVTELANKIGIETSLKANGVTKEALDEAVDTLADRAYEDQCTTANPRQPLVSELKELIYDAFEGEVGYTKKNAK